VVAASHLTVKIALFDFTPELLTTESVSAAALCGRLGVAAPPDWPPSFHDADSRGWFLRKLEADPNVVGWLGFYVIAEIGGRPTLAGSAGFKGPPDADGMVEIGYSIVPSLQRRGIATEAVIQLVSRAFADPRVVTVRAETPLTFTASRGLLEKCSFVLTGTRTDPEDGELALYTRASMGSPSFQPGY
jgi:ribosomal-protein-alanine N-acetyltransferase